MGLVRRTNEWTGRRAGGGEAGLFSVSQAAHAAAQAWSSCLWRFSAPGVFLATANPDLGFPIRPYDVELDCSFSKHLLH